MTHATAHQLARTSHVGQSNRFGEPVIDHVARVATAVPPIARTTAWLHDVIELCPENRGELRRQGLNKVELAALELLAHTPADSYEAYVGRIADAPGPAGELARIVKLADLDDHLSHSVFHPARHRTSGPGDDCWQAKLPRASQRQSPRSADRQGTRPGNAPATALLGLAHPFWVMLA